MTNSPKESAPVALVTAGSRRLGRAMCLHLAGIGYDIALHFNSSESEAKKTALEVEAHGRRCFTFKRDFTHFAQLTSLVTEAKDTFGRLDLLINNASVFNRSKLLTATAETFDSDFQVHVKAPFFLSQAFAKAVERGQIINITDSAAERYSTDYFSYLLSKKTLLALTKMAAKELAPNFRVNAIAPGIILPPENADRVRFEELWLTNPLQRGAGPEDIIKALDYLITSPQVTGQCLFVGGGDHIDY